MSSVATAFSFHADSTKAKLFAFTPRPYHGARVNASVFALASAICYSLGMSNDMDGTSMAPTGTLEVEHAARRRPGGRSSRVRAAVLGATLEALVQGGYEALSIAEVAARSGVHESTIYRRWGTKGGWWPMRS